MKVSVEQEERRLGSLNDQLTSLHGDTKDMHTHTYMIDTHNTHTHTHDTHINRHKGQLLHSPYWSSVCLDRVQLRMTFSINIPDVQFLLTLH